MSIDSEFVNWVIKTKQPRVVYFSSSAAYPVHLQHPELQYHLKESDINLADTVAEPVIRSRANMKVGFTHVNGNEIVFYNSAS